MTKVAVYGDSFAHRHDGWPSYLEKLMKAEITLFGVSGSSVAYSYHKFLETHEKFDLVYFFWTTHDRSWLISTKNSIFNTLRSDLIHYTSFQPHWDIKDTFDLHRQKYNSNLTDDLKKFISNEKENCQLYPDKNFISVFAMKDSVKLRRPDCINISTMDEIEMVGTKLKKSCVGMGNIEKQDMMQFSSKFLDENRDKRPNHLTIKQNEEFAAYLNLSKEGKVDLNKTFKNPSKYYSMSKTFEESGFIR